MSTLLKKAIAYKSKGRQHRRPLTKEDVDLAVAWLPGRINDAQVRGAYGGPNTNSAAFYRIIHALRDALRARQDKNEVVRSTLCEIPGVLAM
jgi:hypothetical protein